MDFPKSVPSVGLVDGKFIDEDPLAGTPGSLIPSEWGNAVTLEMLKVIEDAGLTPDEDDNTQLSAAIKVLVEDGAVEFASQADAEGGTNTTKVMSALRVFQAIAKVVTQATESAFGWLKIATLSQANTGTDDGTAITPKKLAAVLQTQTLNAGATTGTATAYVLSNIPGLSSYVSRLRLNVTFHVGSGANPTINVNTLGAKNLKQYDSDGTKVNAVTSTGLISDLLYDGTDFILVDPLPVAVAQRGQSLRGAAINWKASANGISANIVCSADSVVVANTAGDSTVVDTIALTLNTAVSASATVDGMASGAVAANTWYGIYVWTNSTTGVKRLTGDTAYTTGLPPTPPDSGFDLWARRSAFRTDGAGIPLKYLQTPVDDYIWQVGAGSNVATPRLIASGAAGNPNTNTWIAVPLAAFVGPSASKIKCSATTSNGGFMVVAPNNAYSSNNAANTDTGAPVSIGANATGFLVSQTFEFSIESANIYWAAASGVPRLWCMGWSEKI